MAKDYATLPFTHVRRQDRKVEDENWIREMMRQAPFGTLATQFEGQPFVNTNIFVYVEKENAVYLHTARDGRTRANVEREERVCFTVSEMGRFLPAKTAKEMSVEYAGVVVFGRASVVKDRDEARRSLQLLVDKYFPHLSPGTDYQESTDEELDLTTVYKIHIAAWSGKKKEAPADHPGAFLFGKNPSVDRIIGTQLRKTG